MGRENHQLFEAFPQETMPAYLCEQIFQAISRERIRYGRLRLVISSLCGTGSLVGLVFALPALLSAANTTGFTSYVPLLLSDSDLVASHLSTFGASLLEALPGPEVTLTLFLIAVFLVSLRNFVQSLADAGLFKGIRPSFS